MKTARMDIQQDWTEIAQAAGLAHVDGWDERSVMEGTRDQWLEFHDRLRALDRSDMSRGEKCSHTRCMRRARVGILYATPPEKNGFGE